VLISPTIEEQHRRWKEFIKRGHEEFSASRCAQLVKSMEMVESESQSEDESVEMCTLDESVVNVVSAKKNLMGALGEVEEEENEANVNIGIIERDTETPIPFSLSHFLVARK
jgi:hypothetical protein